MWTLERQPFGPNKTPLLAGLASDNSGVSVPVAVDPVTGRILVNATVSVSPVELPSTLVNGQQTVTTSAVALSTGSLTQGVVLESLSTNTVSIFVGGAGVTTGTGIELAPGGMLGVAVNNTNLIYVICGSTSPIVTWLGS